MEINFRNSGAWEKNNWRVAAEKNSWRVWESRKGKKIMVEVKMD